VVFVNPAAKSHGSHEGLATAAMVLFIVAFGAGVWPCHIISIAMSLHLVNVRVIPETRRAAVIAFSVLELVAWVFLPAFVWYFTETCVTENFGFGDYLDYETYCYEMWWGWIAIIVWYVFGLSFGIPRVVFTFQARKNRAPGQQSANPGVAMATI